MAALGSDASPQEPPSRRLILKNTLQLLAAAGLVSVSGEQVRNLLPLLPPQPPLRATTTCHHGVAWLIDCPSPPSSPASSLQAAQAAEAAAVDAPPCTAAAGPSDLALPLLGGAALGAAAAAAALGSTGDAEAASLKAELVAAEEAQQRTLQEQQREAQGRLDELREEAAALQDKQQLLLQQSSRKAQASVIAKVWGGCRLLRQPADAPYPSEEPTVLACLLLPPGCLQEAQEAQQQLSQQAKAAAQLQRAKAAAEAAAAATQQELAAAREAAAAAGKQAAEAQRRAADLETYKQQFDEVRGGSWRLQPWLLLLPSRLSGAVRCFDGQPGAYPLV